MNKLKKILALMLVLSMLCTLSLTALTGCNEGTGEDETTEGTAETTTPSGEESTGTPQAPATGKADYGVSVTSEGGLPLSDVTLLVYTDSTLSTLAGYGSTDEDGKATVSLDAGKSYSVVVAEAPDGYSAEESYPMVSGTVTEIALSSSVITDDTDISNVSYKLGDIMRDITVTTTDNETLTLSEVLKEKDMVLLNFWYVDCSACRTEFPVMQSVYEEYKDRVEIIAVTPYDSLIDAKSFKESFGLTFPVASIDTDLPSAFEVTGYPTSVIIDRYGMITIIEVGAITTERPFRAIFDRFSGEDYKQEIYKDPSVLTPKEKPNVEMPASDEVAAALGTQNLGITYSPETDKDSAEYSWPFVIGEKNGETCIKPSNAGVEDSFAILYATVELKKDQVLAMDYFASSEKGADILYVLVDRRDIYQISGESTGWKTCYPFVAPEDGTYELSLCYLKDGTDSVGEDLVYVKDLRVETVADIDVATYIPRNVATHLKEDGFGYENYATIVYNETDGYYHVGTENGPLLLASMMNASLFTGNSASVWSTVYNGDAALYDEMVDYFSYASNASLYGYCPVTTKLREYLEKVAENFGIEQTENEWLQMCCYYDAYGTNGEQLEDPTKGLWYHSAFDAKEGKDNVVSYDRPIMPRGLWYEFVPERSGAYRITSYSDEQVDAWIFTRDGKLYHEYDGGERLFTDLINCSMVVYLEAGTPYYIDIAYEDIYCVGSFNFEIKYLSEKTEVFMLASPGFWTFYESEDGVTDTGHLIVGGIDVKLGDDGYYHELRADGTLGSIVYADFSSPTNVFERTSIKEMAELTHSFNGAMSEDDQWVLDFIEIFEEDGLTYQEGFKIEWGDEYEQYMESLKVDEVAAGKYHGTGKDYTDVVKKYIDKMLPTSTATPELEGCVAVTAELAEALQALMDKFSFQAENSWTKLCYYYQYVGPDAAAE